VPTSLPTSHPTSLPTPEPTLTCTDRSEHCSLWEPYCKSEQYGEFVRAVGPHATLALLRIARMSMRPVRCGEHVATVKPHALLLS
jgi:hypothetical protein